MAETEQINVQIDQNALGVVLDAFRSMRDTPSGVDYSMQLTSSPERLACIISKLEEFVGSECGTVTIPMNDPEWQGFTSFIYYAGRHADCLKPEVTDFLDDLEERYSDWEDNGFKPEDASNGPS